MGFYHKSEALLIVFTKNAFIFQNIIDMAFLSCIIGFNACLVLVNFEFIITEYIGSLTVE